MEQEGGEKPGWLALIGVNMPEGKVFHPTVYHLLDRVLKNREPAIQQLAGRLSLACTVRGNTFDEATYDANMITMEILDLYGLTPDAVYEQVVVAYLINPDNPSET